VKYWYTWKNIESPACFVFTWQYKWRLWFFSVLTFECKQYHLGFFFYRIITISYSKLSALYYVIYFGQFLNKFKFSGKNNNKKSKNCSERINIVRMLYHSDFAMVKSTTIFIVYCSEMIREKRSENYWNLSK
jgi:hypothetical protein